MPRDLVNPLPGARAGREREREREWGRRRRLAEAPRGEASSGTATGTDSIARNSSQQQCESERARERERERREAKKIARQGRFSSGSLAFEFFGRYSPVRSFRQARIRFLSASAELTRVDN